MSLQLSFLSLGSKFVMKRSAAKSTDINKMRSDFEMVAKWMLRAPPNMAFRNDVLGGCTSEWVTCGSFQKGRIILYFHGGGYIVGSPQTHRKLAARLARSIEAEAVLIDYPKAPESPLPAAFDAALSAYTELLERGYKSNNIILAGDSAGGGIALTLHAYIAANNLPKPACLYAISPATDFSKHSDSLTRNAKSEAVLPAGRTQELREIVLSGTDPKLPTVSAIYANFSGATPVLIQACKQEILQDDAQNIADHLMDQDVPVTIQWWDNGFHVFQIMAGWVPEATEAIAKFSEFCKLHLTAIDN
jgi:acetyl esterase/lipase